MGDPECQTILPRLKNDFLDLILHNTKKLDSINVEWHDEKSLCIVLCSKAILKNMKIIKRLKI